VGKSPREPYQPPRVRRGMGKMMVMILELRKTRKPVPVDVQCTMDDRVQQNQTQFDISQCTWTKTILMCYGMHL
jgi:hypothetical protein